MEELVKQFNDRITSPLKLYDVTTVNHKPHIFVIGPKHIARHRLAMRAAACARKDCNLSLDEHTYDTVMFLQLERNCTNAEVQHVLKPLCDEIKAAGIDGFTFVETEQKYRAT